MLTQRLTTAHLQPQNNTHYFAVEEPNGVTHHYRVQHKPASLQYPENWFMSYQAGTSPADPKHWSYMGRLDTFTFQVESTNATPAELITSHKWKLLNRILARVYGNEHAAFEQHGYAAYPLCLAGNRLQALPQGKADQTPEELAELEERLNKPRPVLAHAKTPNRVTVDTLRELVEAVPITAPVASSGTMKVYAGSKHGLTPQQFLFCDAVYRLCESRYNIGGDIIVEEMKPEDICKRFRSLDDVEKFIEGRNAQLADMEVTHQ